MQLLFKSLTLNLQHAFGTSRGSSDQKEVFIVKIQAGRHLYGLGEVIFYPYYGQTKELALACLQKLQHLCAAFPVPENLSDVERVIGKIQVCLSKEARYQKDFNHVVNAMDCALVDVLCKTQKISLLAWVNRQVHYQIQPPQFPCTSFTIGVDTPEKIKLKTQEAAPYQLLKIKLGKSIAQDTATILTIREITDKPLRVDANCGWSLETALHMVAFLAEQKIEFIEQPLPPLGISRATPEDYHKLLASTKIPIILDESIVYREDIQKYRGLCSGVNLKLSKCGGLTRCLNMIQDARRQGMKIMLGCMIESGVGINFAFNLSHLCDYADLDGNLLLAQDPYVHQGNLEVKGSRITQVRELPGIGIADEQGF